MSETNFVTRNPRYCLQCDDGTVLVHEKRDISNEFRGVKYHVPAVSGWHCPKCGECEFDPGEGKRHSEALREAARIAAQAQAREIRAIRKKLGLKQAEAGTLFGGGAAAFSEYEHGKTQPHKSMVLLFKLLDRHPEMLRELEGVV